MPHTSSRRNPLRLLLCWLSVLPALFLSFAGVLHAADTSLPFDTLQQRLVADGFDRQQIQTIFASPRVSFAKDGVSAYFLHNEAKLNYKQFKRFWNISAARRYMRTHHEALTYVQATYGVDKEVITAIILVETKLGTYTGKHSVINSLATLAALSDEGPRQIIWNNLEDNRRRMPRNKFDKKADKKSSWAYRELKAFLTHTQKEGMDPTTIKGSYAGAMGISQFMPSNIAPYGRDGNGDGRINLFEHPDAIASIAAYLKRYGWKPGISRKKAYKAVYHYNHSEYYVNTILDIVDDLKK